MSTTSPARERVLLADDHTVVRQGLRKILELDPEITIVGEAGDGRSAVEMAQRLRPNVAVIDVGLPGLNGIEATRQIVAGENAPSVLILSMHMHDAYVREALKAGARGYALKDIEDLDLITAVKVLARGGSYFSPTISKVLLAGYLSESAPGGGKDRISLLTERERRVLQLIAEGKTNKETAETLSIRVSTVEAHRRHLMEKLDLQSTADLVRFALRNGLAE
jgi:two-component system, NarL family, response regulator NreC